MTFAAALAAGVIPFIIGDLIKIVLAVVIGPQIIAICETRKDDAFDFAAMSLIFVLLFP